MEESIPPLPLVRLQKDSPWAYGISGFTYRGYQRMSHDQIYHALVRNGATCGDNIPDFRAWAIAQLEHYGIPHDRGLSNRRLFSFIMAARSKLREIPSNVAVIETELSTKYYFINMRQTESWRWRRKEHYAKIDTITERAAFSIPLLVSQYFLDEKGQPDRSKTPAPLVFLKVSIRYSELQAIVRRVPGLVTCAGGDVWQAIAIGWDPSSVIKACFVMHERVWQRLRIERQANASWYMERHATFSRTHSAHGTAGFDLDMVAGKYHVYCEATEQALIEPLGGMRLTLRKWKDDIFIGEFEIGCLHGIMLLGLADEELVTVMSDVHDEERILEAGMAAYGRCEKSLRNRKDDIQKSNHHDEPAIQQSETENNHQTDSQSEGQNNEHRTGHGTVQVPSPITVQSTDSSNPKSRNSTMSTFKHTFTHPIDLHVRWRARKKNTWHYDLNPRGRGMIRFTDNSCMVFNGEADFVFSHTDNAKFSGYKYDSIPEDLEDIEPGEVEELWFSYSHGA